MKVTNQILQREDVRNQLKARMKNLRFQLIQNDIDFETFYTLFITDFPIYKNPLFKKMISGTWYGENASFVLTRYAENLLKSLVQEEKY